MALTAVTACILTGPGTAQDARRRVLWSARVCYPTLGGDRRSGGRLAVLVRLVERISDEFP